MEDVDTNKQARFYNSFFASEQDICKGLSSSQATATEWQWPTWAKFCQNVVLEILLVSYRYPVPIPKNFS